MTNIKSELSLNVDERIKENKSDGVEETSYEDVLDKIGFGRVQIRLLIVCGIILMAVISETLGMMIITMASQCDLNTNDQMKAILNGASFLGIFLSAHTWGFLADRKGRRKVVLYSLFLSNMFSLASCFVSDFWLFVALRFLSGVGMSGPSACLYAYLGEFNTYKNRPIVITYTSMFAGFASVYIPGIAWLVLENMSWTLPLYTGFEFRPWRLLLILYFLPGFIGALCLSQLPETPKYYLSQGRDEEALSVVRWMYAKNTGNDEASFPVVKLVPEQQSSKVHSETSSKCVGVMKDIWRQTVPLFKPPHLFNFSLCSFVMFGLFFISSGMGLWYAEIQNRVSKLSDDSELTVCTIIEAGRNQPSYNVTADEQTICDDSVHTQTFMDSITLGIFYIMAYIVLGIIINPIGRRTILLVAIVGSGICGLALHWVDEPILMLVCFCLFIMLPGLCVSVLSSSVVDLIPTHLRGMAVCICFMMGRLGSIVGSNLVGYLLEAYCSVMFNLFSVFIIVCGCLTLLIPN